MLRSLTQKYLCLSPVLTHSKYQFILSRSHSYCIITVACMSDMLPILFTQMHIIETHTTTRVEELLLMFTFCPCTVSCCVLILCIQCISSKVHHNYYLTISILLTLIIIFERLFVTKYELFSQLGSCLPSKRRII